MTVPVWKKHLGLQRIDRVRICDGGQWARKHLGSLAHAYANAPYYEDLRPFLEKCLVSGRDKMLDLNLEILKYVIDTLDLDTRIVLQSDLGVDSTGDGLLVEICRKLNADALLAQTPARKYLNAPFIAAAGLTLRYLQIPYLCLSPTVGRFYRQPFDFRPAAELRTQIP